MYCGIESSWSDVSPVRRLYRTVHTVLRTSIQFKSNSPIKTPQPGQIAIISQPSITRKKQGMTCPFILVKVVGTEY